MKKANKEIVLIIHNVRSSENVGAMFRTADAGGVSKIYLTGYTPRPIDRFGRTNNKLTKASLGAEKFVEWEHEEKISELIANMKKEDYQIISVEQDKKSLNYKEVKTKNKFVLIMGNEVKGLPKNILKLSDIIAEIPMQGKKESLNVSVSFGIVLFGIQ